MKDFWSLNKKFNRASYIYKIPVSPGRHSYSQRGPCKAQQDTKAQGVGTCTKSML